MQIYVSKPNGVKMIITVNYKDEWARINKASKTRRYRAVLERIWARQTEKTEKRYQEKRRAAIERLGESYVLHPANSPKCGDGQYINLPLRGQTAQFDTVL